jgi:hypothetical protein
MDRRFFLRLAALQGACALGALACTPSIGDKCTTSTNCSIRGDRLCDTSQPGGYCTVFNCEPGTCPEEAQCVAFNRVLDPVCTDPRQWPRFERTFCMKRCEDNGDCRGGYACIDMASQPNPWGAYVVDFDPSGTAVCIPPFTASAPSGALSEVCRPYDGGFPDVGYYEPDVAQADAGDEPDASVADEPGSADAADGSLADETASD